jgi:uncharacterized protein
MLDKKLINQIIEQYSMSLDGLHGIAHWARVLENGRRLARQTKANMEVVELFAIFHDSKRVDDGFDKGHGQRGAEYALSIRGSFPDITDESFDLLFKACKKHTDGQTEADITIQTCWDADRLDLNRISVRPSTEYLCTEPAKASETIDWANERSSRLHVPDLVFNEWGINLSRL